MSRHVVFTNATRPDAHNCIAKTHKTNTRQHDENHCHDDTDTCSPHEQCCAQLSTCTVRIRTFLLDKDARLTLRERNVPWHSTCPAHLLHWQKRTVHKPTTMKCVRPQPLIADTQWATTQQRRNEYGHETKLDTNNLRRYIGKQNHHDPDCTFAWCPTTYGVIAARPSGAIQDKLESTYTRSHSAEICSVGRSKNLCQTFFRPAMQVHGRTCHVTQRVP